MIGSLLKYEIDSRDHIAVILEYCHGFHMRKTWSADWHLVNQPMCKIYWFNKPDQKPPHAHHEIAKEWRADHDLSFGFGHPGTFSEEHKAIIKEWNTLSKEQEWYFLKNFKFVEEIRND